MEKNIIKLLHDWLPIIIAALSLIISIITNKKIINRITNIKEECKILKFKKK